MSLARFKWLWMLVPCILTFSVLTFHTSISGSLGLRQIRFTLHSDPLTNTSIGLTAPTSAVIYAKAPPDFESLFTPPDANRKDYHEWNAQTLRELHSCLLLNSCGQNQTKVAILGAHWFQEAVVTGFRGGEGIWAISVYGNLRAMGYTTFFAIDFSECLALYRTMPDLVKVVIRNMAGDCHSDPMCVKGPTNPTGIPAWKIFDFQFFSSDGAHYGASRLRGPWILSADVLHPDFYLNNLNAPQYIGYSIENDCTTASVLPLAQRHNRVWLLMKQLSYVYQETFAWNHTVASSETSPTSHITSLPDIFLATKTDFTGGWATNQDYQWNPKTQGRLVDIVDPKHGIVNLGKLNETEFVHEVGMSKAMLGVGGPWWSPSPYNALCQGVPFINPVLSWDHYDPSNRLKWMSQHPSLSLLDPPYVYNVFAHDLDGLVDAIKKATTTEIGSFIPERMTNGAIRTRLASLMEMDWKEKARALLELRIQEGGTAYTFEL